jgi:hypothetical protein
MSRFDHRNVIAFGALLIVLAGASEAATDDLCETAGFSDVNTTLRFHGGDTSTRQCFTTELPSAGWLLLEATVPSTAAVEPRLEFLGHRCDASLDDGRPFLYHTRSAGSLLVEVAAAGSYRFCVAPQDPVQWLDDYRVINRFAAFDKDHGYEHEPDPDPLADPSGCGGSRIGQIAFGKDHGYEHEPDPDPFSSPADCVCRELVAATASDKDHGYEHEPDPDPFAIDPCDPSRRRVCFGSVADDYADTLGCAAIVALGRPVSAALGDGWQDDGDLFAFHVDEPATVWIESTGASDTVGGLYDRYGNRLRSDDDSGAAANFRIVKSLTPGWYFARVEGGAGDVGTYELTIEAFATQE